MHPPKQNNKKAFKTEVSKALSGDPYRIQTYNLLIRSQILYSVELTGHTVFFVTHTGFKPVTF